MKKKRKANKLKREETKTVQEQHHFNCIAITYIINVILSLSFCCCRKCLSERPFSVATL